MSAAPRALVTQVPFPSPCSSGAIGLRGGQGLFICNLPSPVTILPCLSRSHPLRSEGNWHCGFKDLPVPLKFCSFTDAWYFQARESKCLLGGCWELPFGKYKKVMVPVEVSRGSIQLKIRTSLFQSTYGKIKSKNFSKILGKQSNGE